MSIPDFMPVLSSGGHSGPSKGACVMEYISLLAGEEWTDDPECTHPLLSTMARHINDQMCDDHRHLLVPLIPRLMGTDRLNRQTEADLYDWIAHVREARDRYPGVMLLSPMDVVNAVMRLGSREDDCANHCRSGVALLEGAITEYDRLAGRTEYREVTEADLRMLAEVVRQ